MTFALSLSPQSGGTDGDADFDPAEDLAELLQWGPEAGIHLLVHAESWSALKESGCREGDFPHVAAFRMNDADALNILDNYARQARRLPEGVFMYTDRRDIRMFVPYDNADAGSPGGTGP